MGNDTDATSIKTKPTRYRRRIEILTIKKRLKEVDRITWTELESVAGRAVRPGNPGYGSLHKARKELEPEGIFFGSQSADLKDDEIFTGGLRRLTDEEVVKETVARNIAGMRSMSGLARKRLESISFDSLNPETRVMHNTLLSVARVGTAITNPGMIESIEENVRKGNMPIPSKKLILMLPDMP